MLGCTDLVEYLARKDLLDPRSVVENDLVLVEFRRRNLSYGVVSANSPSYLIKQALGARGREGIVREANIYALLSRARTATGRFMAPYLPVVIHFDEKLGVLVLEYLRDAQTLLETYDERARFPCRHSAHAATALATLHQLSLEQGDAEALMLPPPAALKIHRPDLDALCNMSAANRQFIGLLQRSSQLCLLLDSLRAEWRSLCLVHADVKWANIVFHRNHSRIRRSAFKLVDWEFAGVGDPAWDVGSVFHDYLYWWLLSAPVLDNATPQRLVEMASIPLEKIQPALRAFWAEYKRLVPMNAADEGTFLEYAVRYAAARLLQSVFEHNQNVSEMLGNAVYFVQLALNMLKNPRQASLRLLGIPVLARAYPFAPTSTTGPVGPS